MRGIILTITILTTLGILAAAEWSLAKDKNGIKVYTRPYQGHKLKEFKGITVINSTPEKVAALLKDISKQDQIMYKCRKGTVKMIKKVSDNEFYTYMEIDTPWPATDRDVITMYKFSTDAAGVITCQIKAMPNMVPKKEGFVRVPVTEGYWKMEPVGNSQVRVTTQAYSDPGGSVPDAMANATSVDVPYHMLSAIKAILE